MKKSQKITMAAIGVALALGITAFASSYDSSEDPLISLSYLTNIFKPEIQSDYEAKISALESKITELEGEISNGGASTESAPSTSSAVMYDDPQTTQSAASSASSTYEVVQMTTGDVLYAQGACDIMLRAGSAVCIAPDATQGIADYTSAYEIYNGEYLTKNHMCLIPRGDGRGIMAASESVYVMVRGEYTIVKAS